MPQNWLFLTSYKKQREHLLKTETWNLVARLGPGAFDTISGEVVNAILLTLIHAKPVADQMLRGLDASTPRTVEEKAALLREAEVVAVEQAGQLGNPDARVALEVAEKAKLLSEYADGLVGMQTSDDPMFITAFWEFSEINNSIWELLQATPESLQEFDGESWLVRWEQGEGLLLSLPTAYPTKGLKALGKSGVAIHRMRQIFAYRYGKERFHQNVAVILPNDPNNHLPAIWCFCSSPEYSLPNSHPYIRMNKISILLPNFL